MSDDGLPQYSWHYANDVLAISITSDRVVVEINGEMAAIGADFLSKMPVEFAPIYLSGLYLAGYAASTGALVVTVQEAPAHG